MTIDVDSGRQSGRTARALTELPDGSIYLVHDMKFADYCRRLLRHLGRNPDAISFASPHNFHRFEGARFAALQADHAYWGLARGRGSEAYDFLRIGVF